MRIQHNIMAMSAYRNYTNNVSAMKKNLEKLSSGYKINRAGDDAAGLAISEKMRAQITGLETAQKNAKDGISLVQTAEGALTEVHDMLNRMVELATQSANGTYDNTTDRDQLQKEVNQLRSEINRIADSANFNGIKLLDGSMDGTVTTDTTEYTKGKNNIPILQDVALNPTEEVGEKTVLHVDGSTVTGKTQFKVELHSTQLSGVNGDTVSVKIGDKTLNFTFDKNATDNTSAPGKLKEGSLSATDFGDAVVAAWNAGTKLLGGQAFNVTNDNGTLIFEQASNPTNSTEIVEPFREVTIEFTSSNSQAKSATVLNAAQKNALAKSQKIVLNGKEYDFAISNSAASLTKTYDGFEIKYDNGKLEVTNTAGTAGVSSLAIGGAAATTDIVSTAASQTNGSAANAASSGDITLSMGSATFGSVNATKITFYAGDGSSKSFEIAGASASGTASVAIGGTTYTLSWGNNDQISLTAATAGTDGNQNLMVKIEQKASATASYAVAGAQGFSTTDGANQVGGKAVFDLGTVTQGETIEFNGKKFTVNSSVADTAKEIAAYAQSAFGDMFEMVEANGTKLEFTSKITVTAANVSNMVVLKKGGAEETDITDLLEDKPIASEAGGTWNIKTTENKMGSVSGPGVLASTTFKLNSGIVKDGNVLTIGNKNFTFKVGKDSTTTGENVIDLSKFEEGDAGLIGEAAKILGQQTTDAFTIGYDKDNEGVISIHEIANQQIYTNGELSDVGTFDALVYFNSKEDATSTETTTAGGNSLMLQIGDTADEFNQLKVNIKDMHADAMGIGDISIANQEDAAKAVDAIKAAINYVSDMRGTLGATQNRLDHTINNLSVMTENIQDAESTIRDTDVADEMMAYTKNNILIQSAQAMLAQANQVPQGVLQLLQ